MVIKIILFLTNVILINVSFILAFLVRYGQFPERNFTPYKNSFVFLTLIYIEVLVFFGVYKNRFKSSWVLFERVSSGVFLGTLLSVAFIYVFRTQWGKFPTSIFAISFFVNLILIFKVNLFILKAKKRIKKQVIILGEGKVDDIVDKDGKTFTLYKFRTMVKDAEQKVGPVLAKQDDPRITRIGKVLRRTRMDELPQLFNVLCGQMSLVGIMLQTIPVVFLKKGW